MEWFAYALMAPAVYAVVNFADKYIIGGLSIDYRGMPLYGTAAGLAFGTVFWVACGFPVLSPRDTLIVLLTGVLTLAGSVTYFKAVAHAAASRVIILLQMVPLMVLALSWAFLGETVSSRQAAGFFLVMAATVGLVARRERGSFRFDAATFWLLFFTDLLWAASNVLFKFVSAGNSFSRLIAYESWGIGLGGLLLYAASPGVRRAFHGDLARLGAGPLALIFMNESVFVLSKYLSFLAIALGPVTLVSVLAGTQVFFGVLYGILAGLAAPRVFDEDLSRGGLLQGTGFALVMFAGVWLLR